MSEIRYLTTDLDVCSSRSLVRLVKALEPSGIYEYHKSWPGRVNTFAVFGTTTQHAAPEESLGQMLGAIEALTGRVADLWAGCSLREFNIGYDCGDRPWAFNNGLSNDVLRRLVTSGATLRITLYPPEKIRMPPKRRKTKTGDPK